jgi:serine protease Do
MSREFLLRMDRPAGRSTSRWVATALALALSGAALAHGAPPASGMEMAEATAEDFAFATRLSRVFNTVAKRCEPSVVHITQFRRVQARDFFGRPVGRAQVQQTGLGSGAIVDGAGIVLTNEHVVRDGEQLRVRISDGREFDAKLVGSDESTDLAVLKFDPRDDSGNPIRLQALEFANSDEVQVGQWVIAIGSPFGLDSSVTQGIISAKGRTVTPRETGTSYQDYMQTDAAINPGNSGGPLISLDGKIVGVNSAIASRTGGYDGIGFAIPSNTARAVLENILQNGKLVRGWLGVELADAPPENGVSPGVRVVEVVPDGPAERAGLRAGDLVTRFQGSPVNEVRLRQAIAITAPGTTVNVDVVREGEPKALAVTLDDRTQASRALAKERGNAWIDDLGVEVATITPSLARELGYRRLQGVVVQGIEPQGKATNELLAGDVIIGVNDQQFADAAEFEGLVREVTREVRREGGTLRLNVIRGRMRGYVEIP